MVSSSEEWPNFASYMEEFCCNKTFFPNFRIRYISRAQNTIADETVRSRRSSLSVILYVDSTLRLGFPNRWFSSKIEYCCRKKNHKGKVIFKVYFKFNSIDDSQIVYKE